MVFLNILSRQIKFCGMPYYYRTYLTTHSLVLALQTLNMCNNNIYTSLVV
jgi:hypothetical protein